MKPSNYLSDLAKEYFKTFEAILKERGMDNDQFNDELSMLATEFANYQEAQEDIQKKGPYVTFQSGAQQIGPWVTFKEKSVSNILKLAPKFGFNPLDLQKLKITPETKDKKKPLEKFK